MLIFAQYYAKCAQNRAFLGLKVVENVKNLQMHSPPVLHALSSSLSLSSLHPLHLVNASGLEAGNRGSKCKNCTLEEIVVLRIIQQDPSATQTYIAKEIRKLERIVKTITARLTEKGIMKRSKGK